jgi:hypothetical protein
MAKHRELEKSLEDRCVAKVEAIGGKALKLKLDGVRGWPDRTVLLRPSDMRPTWKPDRVFFIELKREDLGVVSAQQRKWRTMLNLLGFEVYLVASDAEFDRVLELWK